MSLSNIKRPITSCNKPVIKLISSFECTDSINDDYYGTGDIIDGSAGVSAFPFVKISNIRGFIKDIPREITRQNSLNCRTQKVSSTIKYDLQGADFYPAWKMREIEGQFHAKQIFIDDQDVKYSGGTMFEVIGTFCPPLFRFRTTVEECRREQIFGCSTECQPNCYYFLIPSYIVTQIFYNDAGIQIASSFQELMAWYAAQTNVTEVTEITQNLQIECEYYKVFKVIATGYIPSFFYFDNPSAVNKVYGVTLDCELPNYSKLCGEINNGSCGALSINVPEVFELICGDVTIGDVEVFVVGGLCVVQPNPNWVQHTGITDLIQSGSQRTLNLSLFNLDYIGTNPSTGEYQKDFPDGTGAFVCEVEVTGSEGATITEVLVDGVPLDPSDYSYNPANLRMEFDPCLVDIENITVHFTTPGITPMLSGQIIAIITGPSCMPLTPVYMTNAQNSTIPAGSTLVIEVNGNVKWFGSVTSFDNSGSVIEVENIIYNV